MGAFSSWPALDFVHHLLVQFSYWMATNNGNVGLLYSGIPLEVSLFDNYRVCGDDIVIGEKEVAKYYSLLCKELQIPISEHKSLVSKRGAFLFVNQFWFGEHNLSPISLRQELSVTSAAQRINFGIKLLLRRFTSDLTRATPMELVRMICNHRLFDRATDDVRKGRVSILVSSAVTGLSLLSPTLFPESVRKVVGPGVLGWLLPLFQVSSPVRLLQRTQEAVDENLLRLMARLVRQLLFDEVHRLRLLNIKVKDLKTKIFLETKVGKWYNERLPPKLEMFLGSLYNGPWVEPNHVLPHEIRVVVNDAALILQDFDEKSFDWLEKAVKCLRSAVKVIPTWTYDCFEDKPLSHLVHDRLRMENERVKDANRENTWYYSKSDLLDPLLERIYSKRYINIVKSDDHFDPNVYGLRSREMRRVIL